MSTFIRLLVLVILLNVVRYLAGIPLEQLYTLPRLSAEMEAHASYFKTDFTTFDWVTSYLYNFMLWLTTTWVYHKMHPALAGVHLLKSLKVYGLMYLMFASISFIYMNHYSHPKWFYIYNVMDCFIAFAVVAIANGLLYPLVFRQKKTAPVETEVAPTT